MYKKEAHKTWDKRGAKKTTMRAGQRRASTTVKAGQESSTAYSHTLYYRAGETTFVWGGNIVVKPDDRLGFLLPILE